MGWLEAAVQMVKATLWPAVVVFAVLFLRIDLRRLLGRITHVRSPVGEADFATEVAATHDLASVVAPEKAERLPESQSSRTPLAENPTLEDLLSEADLHPVGAIVRAWNVVVGALPQDRRKIIPIENAVVMLVRFGDTPADLIDVAVRLTRLRSSAVHGRVIPDSAAARNFVDAAWRLATAITDGFREIDARIKKATDEAAAAGYMSAADNEEPRE